MKKLIADAKLMQDGKWYYRGQEFEANEQDAADLEAMGMAHAATITERVKRTYRRRDMTAQ